MHQSVMAAMAAIFFIYSFLNKNDIYKGGGLPQEIVRPRMPAGLLPGCHIPFSRNMKW